VAEKPKPPVKIMTPKDAVDLVNAFIFTNSPYQQPAFTNWYQYRPANRKECEDYAQELLDFLKDNSANSSLPSRVYYLAKEATLQVSQALNDPKEADEIMKNVKKRVTAISQGSPF
jgi:hypothetical protein